MSTIKSDDSNITINASGSGRDIKFQANGVEKASISSAGAFTSTTIDATKLTGDLPAISGANLTGVGVAGITSTADATAITIDSSEQVGIANTSPNSYDAEAKNLVVGSGTGHQGMTIVAGTLSKSKIHFADGTGAASYKGMVHYDHNADTLNLATSGNDRLSITSDGRILAGEGSFAGGAETLTIRPVTDGGVNDYVLMLQTGTTNSATIIRFFTPNGVAGVVSTSGSNTSYGTSSDYRLKENVDYDWDATTRLKQLKPARFNWIEDDTNTLQDGFIAHEVSSVVPEAISGEKDGMETYTDENGDKKTRIAPQSIDQSKLVPLLVKTIQELEARITALEA